MFCVYSYEGRVIIGSEGVFRGCRAARFWSPKKGICSPPKKGCKIPTPVSARNPGPQLRAGWVS